MGPDHSLSVAGEPEELSASPALLPPFFMLPDAAPREDELELMSLSFTFSFSSKSMNMRFRASLYAASRSSMVMRFLLLPPVVLLLPPKLLVSDGSRSDKSASSVVTEAACCWEGLPRRSIDDRRIILKAGAAVVSAGTSSDILSGGLELQVSVKCLWRGIELNDEATYMRLSDDEKTYMVLLMGSVSGVSL